MDNKIMIKNKKVKHILRKGIKEILHKRKLKIFIHFNRKLK